MQPPHVQQPNHNYHAYRKYRMSIAKVPARYRVKVTLHTYIMLSKVATDIVVLIDVKRGLSPGDQDREVFVTF